MLYDGSYYVKVNPKREEEGWFAQLKEKVIAQIDDTN